MRAKPRVLVADDDKLVRQVFYHLLHVDFEVIPAISGEEIIELVRCVPAFDVILLDIHMPGPPMTEVLSIIYDYQPTTGVVLFTGDVDSALVRSVLASGTYRCVRKPVSRDLLYALVQEAVCEHRARINNAEVLISS